MEAYDSVIAFAEHAVVHLHRLDMVILNAGTLESEASVSPYTDNETMFQVNYLSTALLAKLLVPVLKIIQPEREPSRLTVITTGFYNPHKDRFSLPDFEDMCRTELLEDGFRAKMKRFRQFKRFLQPYLSMLAAVVNPDEVIINLVTTHMIRDTQLTENSMHKGWFRRKLGVGLACTCWQNSGDRRSSLHRCGSCQGQRIARRNSFPLPLHTQVRATYCL